MKSLRASGLASPIPADVSGRYAFLAKLHQVAWGKRDFGTIFHDHVVQRDSHRQQGPPQTVKALRWMWDEGSLTAMPAPFNVSSILVRKDYVNLLFDLLRDVLKVPPEETRVVPIPGDGMDMDHDVQLSDRLFDYLSRPLRARAAIILGTPGIGKSLFLFFVLALRVLAGLPTIIQWHMEALSVLTHEGAFNIDYPIRRKPLRSYIDKGTWILVDSGDITMPSELTEFCLNIKGLILQAASPRKDHIEWSKKMYKTPARYWMALWTPEELIQARDLQVWDESQRPSDEVLLEFCQLYGCSARYVYGNAAEKAGYEYMVNSEIATLTREKINVMLNNLQGLAFDDEVSHFITVAAPDPSNRRRMTVLFASGYLTDEIMKALEVTEQAGSHLY